MCPSIHSNGWSKRKGSHVGVVVHMKGEFDSHLKWPFRREITIKLVNQKEGGVNYEKKTSCTH